MPPISSLGSKSSPINKAKPGTNKTSSKFSRWVSTWITDWWGLELLSWLISALSLLAIVLTLETHKNKPLPEWPLKITLNSLISIFAQVAQMGMMKPVVECISQLKWLWFVRKEKLSNFGVLDDASRGPTGSLILLGKLRGLHLISLGAILTIISIAFGPFAQQIVSYPPRLQPIGGATVVSVVNYTGPNLNNTSGLDSYLGDVGVYSAIYDALGTDQNLSTIAPLCTSGNCTFKEYHSIGVCANTTDLSASIISHSCNTTALDLLFEASGNQNPGYPCFNYTIPYLGVGALANLSGFTADASLSDVSLDKSGPNNAVTLSMLSFYQEATNTSLASYYTIYQPNLTTITPNSSLDPPVAFRTSLDLCIHTYNTSVKNGVTNTTLLSAHNLDIYGQEELLQGGLDYIAANANNISFVTYDGVTFSISRFGSGGVSLLLDGAFASGQCNLVTLLNEPGSPGSAKYTYVCTNDATSAFLNAMVSSTDPFNGINGLMENVAISLTNQFRRGNGGESGLVYLNGTALGPVDFVETQYLWLLLPIALVSLTLIFLLATIIKSQRLGSRVWKSSNLATLQGLHIDLHTKLGGISSISEMEEKIENLNVRFDMEGGKAEHGVDYRLVEEKLNDMWSGRVNG